MTKEEYAYEIRRVTRSRKLGKPVLPKSVWNYGWEKYKTRSQSELVGRILFWLYAYDKSHKWTNKDFDYPINDRAYELAKAKRKERKEKAQAYFLAKHNKPRPLPKIETSWDEVSGPPQDLLEGLYEKLKSRG